YSFSIYSTKTTTANWILRKARHWSSTCVPDDKFLATKGTKGSFCAFCGYSLLFTRQMVQVAIVLVADEFHQLDIRPQVNILGHRPRFRVSLGIVDGDGDVHMSKVFSFEPFDHVQGVRRRAAQLV